MVEIFEKCAKLIGLRYHTGFRVMPEIWISLFKTCFHPALLNPETAVGGYRSFTTRARKLLAVRLYTSADALFLMAPS